MYGLSSSANRIGGILKILEEFLRKQRGMGPGA